jgi:hypothetical protein
MLYQLKIYTLCIYDQHKQNWNLMIDKSISREAFFNRRKPKNATYSISR